MAWAWVEELIALKSNHLLNEDRDEQSMRLELTLSYNIFTTKIRGKNVRFYVMGSIS